MDLFLPSSTAGVSDEQVLARSRQQIVSLMQRFRFIRQCIKCSAKNLLRVDEVFLKAQQAVLYPFTPLYNLDIGRLSEDCKRAFTRIFRMYDRDHDGLLSHAELDRFQHETFHVPVYERDLAGWKKVVTRNNPNEEVVRDGKFTVTGFLAIFDVFISQNRLDVPWQALRKFGYDDNLVLHVPEGIKQGAEAKIPVGAPGQPLPQYKERWSLTPSARRFLTDIFHQFDSDNDGVLSLDDIQSIFSVVADPALPPWHPLRAQEEFEGCFSLPIMPSSPDSPPDSSSSSPGTSSPLNMSQSLSASGITIVSGDSFPSVDISAVSAFTNAISKPLSYLKWMGMWHAISAISPPQTRAELFRLGHVEDPKRYKKSRRGKKKSAVAPNASFDSLLPSQEVRALLLGSPGSGKTALLNALGCSSREPLTTSKTRSPRTSSTYVKLKRKSPKSKSDSQDEMYVAHLIITEVPEAVAENQAQRKKELSEILHEGGCDLVILAFDSTNSASLAYAKHLESSLLTDDMSRVYVGTKSDQCSPTEDRDIEEDDEWQPTTVIDEASIRCRELDLEPPLVTSASDTMLSAEGELGELQRQKALEHLARCVISESGSKRLRAKPHEERKRQEAAKRRNRKMVWFGVGVGVAVAVVGYLITGATGVSSNKQEGKGRARLSWLRSLFSLGSSGAATAGNSSD
jgi:Ras family protein T1